MTINEQEMQIVEQKLKAALSKILEMILVGELGVIWGPDGSMFIYAVKDLNYEGEVEDEQAAL